MRISSHLCKDEKRSTKEGASKHALIGGKSQPSSEQTGQSSELDGGGITTTHHIQDSHT